MRERLFEAAAAASAKSVKAHYAQNQFGSNSYPYRRREASLAPLSRSLPSLAPSTLLAFSVPSGRGILASLAKIRMRLILLTVEGRGLARGFKRRRRRRALRTVGEGTRRQRGKNNVHRQEAEELEKREKEEEEKERKKKKKATPEVEVKIILREFHLSTRRGREVPTGEEESGPAFPLPFSLPSSPASLFVFTLGASRGGCVKARL